MSISISVIVRGLMSDDARWRTEAGNPANVVVTISLNAMKSHILF